MENQNEQLTRQLHEYFSKNQFDKCLEMSNEKVQVVAHPIGMTFNGRNEFLGFMQSFKQAFPDMVIQHTNIISNGNKVAVEFTATGTHTGPFSTPQGNILPTGKKISLNVSEFHIWENDKLSRIVNYQDAGAMMRQIGAL